MMKKICSYYCVKNLPLLLPSGKSYSSYSCHYCSACFSWYQFGTTSLFATKKKALVNYTGHPKYVPFFLLHYILTTRHLVYVSQLRISLKQFFRLKSYSYYLWYPYSCYVTELSMLLEDEEVEVQEYLQQLLRNWNCFSVAVHWMKLLIKVTRPLDEYQILVDHHQVLTPHWLE